jgi:hypothetical protein
MAKEKLGAFDRRFPVEFTPDEKKFTWVIGRGNPESFDAPESFAIWTEMWDCQTKHKLTFDENMECVKREEFEQFPFVVFSGEQSYVGDISFVERKILHRY